MNTNRLIRIGLAALSLMAVTSVAVARYNTPQPALTLVETVQHATEPFRDVAAAEAAGYQLLHGCVSGQQEGAMGIHFANGDLVGDGALDALHPEALLYEARGGQLRLLGVEYVVLAEAWDAVHEAPPVLMGQMFNYVSSPNRYRLPAFYELHVWAWKGNPSGTFADWNPRVSCDDFGGDAVPHEADHK